jgi:hypothetical protein
MAAARRLIHQGAGAMTGAFSLLKRLIFGAALAWLATPPAAFADDAPQMGAPELDNKQIEILYTAPQASYLKPLYDRLRQRQFLEQLKQFLSPLNIPPGITLKITTKECGQTNSWWAGRQDGLFLCYEWLDFALRVAPQTTTPDGMTREDAVLGAFLQVTFHELGHGMFDIYEIPILGREEDAADQIAGFILSQFGSEITRRTLPGTVYLWRALADSDGPWRHDAFSDIHGQPLQRAYNYLCMAYGADPQQFQYFVDKGYLPKERAGDCGREFAQIRHAFATTLYPHIDPAKMKIVQSRQWLLPQGQELAPPQ